MRQREFDLKQLLYHFSDISGMRWGITFQIDKLEKVFSPVKNGQEGLALKHVIAVRDDYAFMNWWKMPEIREDDLIPLQGVFVHVGPKDVAVIGRLFDLLKNIEIVSCVLRFTDPKNYGILSPPVENILSIKGKNPIEKYINYLSDLEELKERYGFERIADVDMALWALSNIINYSYLRHHPEYSKIFEDYEQTTNLVKRIMARNSLERIKEEKPLYKAELFLDSDHIVAGLIAGRELGLFIKELCSRHGIKVVERTVKKDVRFLSTPELSDKLEEVKVISKEEKNNIGEWWRIRCCLIHEEEKSVSREEIETMIEGIGRLKEKPL